MPQVLASPFVRGHVQARRAPRSPFVSVRDFFRPASARPIPIFFIFFIFF